MSKRCFAFVATFGILLVLSGVARAAPPAGVVAAPQITCTGKVVNAQGGAVEGAKVTLYQRIYTEAASTPASEALGEKSTGADGTFTFTLTPGAAPRRLSYVVARKEGLALGWAMWRMLTSEQLDVTLGEPRDLVGEVVDEQGRPLAEADVGIAIAVMGKPPDRRYLSAPDFLDAKTDREGRFLFAALPAEATLELWTGKPGRATVGTFDRSRFRGPGYQFAPGQTGIKLTLPPEARIEGVVVDKGSGKPIAGVSLMAQIDPPQGITVPSKPATTAEDGTFHVGSLAPGTYAVQLVSSVRGQMPEWVAAPVQVSLQAGQMKSGIKLQLAKGGVIEVLVKDADSKPVASAGVNLRDIQVEQWVGGITDQRGLAQIRVMPGSYSFSGAYREGYSQSTSQEQVTIEEGQTKRIECTLRAMPKVAGVVRGEAGDLLAGVKVEVKPSGRGEATTDASGRFEVAWDPASWGPQATTFILVARDTTRNLAQAVDIDEQTTRLDVKLKPGATVVGAVQSEEGKPLPGARISVILRSSNWGASLGRAELTAGPDGRFEIKALPAEQRYTVTAMADGYGRRQVQVEGLAVKNNRHDLGQLKLPWANLTISGMVVDPNDKPVAHATIYGYGPEQPDRRDITTDAEGRFTINGVCAGPMRLNVDSPGPKRMYGYAQAEGGATDLRIVISQRPTGQPYMPRRPASLKGQPLPSLKDLGIDLPPEAQGKMLLICFWDVGQRPSRYCLTQLAAQASALDGKGVVLVPVHAAQGEDGALREWTDKNKLPLKMGSIAGDVEKTKFAWGVTSLPHLILTGRQHTVIAEGFSPADLDKQIEAAGR